MNRFTYVTFVLLVLSCKTVSREEFDTKMSDISVKLPDDLKDYDAKVSFTRLGSSAEAKVIRGQDIAVKLPAGTYKINLTLLSKSGSEEYEACNKGNSYTFTKPQEDAIIDICRKSDRTYFTKTLATKIQNPIPSSAIPSIPGSGEKAVVSPPIGTTGGGSKITPPVIETLPAIPEVVKPVLLPEGTCFGLRATVVENDLHYVIKIADQIKEEIFDLTKARTCKFIFEKAKPSGKGFAAKSNTFFFSADSATYSAGFKFQSSALDEGGRKATKCKSVFIKADGSNGTSSVCAFYDTIPATYGTVSDADKPDYEASCKATTKKLIYEFKLVGFQDKYIENLSISEIRVDKPEVQACL